MGKLTHQTGVRFIVGASLPKLGRKIRGLGNRARALEGRGRAACRTGLPTRCRYSGAWAAALVWLCCSGSICNPQPIVDQGLAAFDRAIAALQAQSSSWQATLKSLESDIANTVSTDIRTDVSNLLQNSIGVANAGAQCTLDFVGHRVLQALLRIRAKFANQPIADDRTPAICSAVPAALLFGDWQSGHVPTITFYGYDLDAPTNLKLKNDVQTVDVTSALSRTSAYQVVVNMGGNGVKLTSASEGLSLLAPPSNVLSMVPVVQPLTPICKTRTSPVFQGTDISFTPPHVGGDNDFDGHGPVVTTSLTLSVAGSSVQWSLFMDAKETKRDWTEVRGTKTGVFYTAEPGWAVQQIVGATVSSDTYTDNNHDKDLRFPGSGPVREFEVVGDTGGDDVGRTSVLVHFRPDVQFKEVQNANCVSESAGRQLVASLEAAAPTGGAASAVAVVTRATTRAIANPEPTPEAIRADVLRHLREELAKLQGP